MVASRPPERARLRNPARALRSDAHPHRHAHDSSAHPAASVSQRGEAKANNERRCMSGLLRTATNAGQSQITRPWGMRKSSESFRCWMSASAAGELSACALAAALLSNHRRILTHDWSERSQRRRQRRRRQWLLRRFQRLTNQRAGQTPRLPTARDAPLGASRPELHDRFLRHGRQRTTVGDVVEGSEFGVVGGQTKPQARDGFDEAQEQFRDRLDEFNSAARCSRLGPSDVRLQLHAVRPAYI